MNENPKSMNLREMIKEWQQSIADKYCGDCIDHCCKGNVRLYEGEYEQFVEAGAEVFNAVDIKKVEIGIYERYRLKDGSDIPQNSLLMLKDKVLLYQQTNCLYYNNGCLIHEKKPANCKRYPLHIRNDGRVLVNENCKAFNLGAVRSNFQRRFPMAEILNTVEYYCKYIEPRKILEL